MTSVIVEILGDYLPLVRRNQTFIVRMPEWIKDSVYKFNMKTRKKKVKVIFNDTLDIIHRVKDRVALKNYECRVGEAYRGEWKGRCLNLVEVTTENTFSMGLNWLIPIVFTSRVGFCKCWLADYIEQLHIEFHTMLPRWRALLFMTLAERCQLVMRENVSATLEQVMTNSGINAAQLGAIKALLKRCDINFARLKI